MGMNTRAEVDYESALMRATAAVVLMRRHLVRERSASQVRVRRLLPLNVLQRRLLVRNAASYRTWAVGRGLLDEALARLETEPGEAAALAWLVLEDVLAEGRLRCRGLSSPAMVKDLEALAWGVVACNRRRLGFGAPAVASAWARARAAARVGTGDREVRSFLRGVPRRKSPVSSARIGSDHEPAYASLCQRPRDPGGLSA